MHQSCHIHALILAAFYSELLSFCGQIGFSWTVLAWVFDAIAVEGEWGSEGSTGRPSKMARVEAGYNLGVQLGLLTKGSTGSLLPWFGHLTARESQCNHVSYGVAGLREAGRGSYQVSSERPVKGYANN